MSKTDFLSWDDDLDLDILLGEYTDTDPIVDSDDDFVLETVVHPPKKVKGIDKSLSEHGTAADGYECPDCDKILKSISGFRGHTSRQHGKDLKATDHKANKPDVLVHVQEKENTHSSTPQISIDEIFPNAYKSTLKALEDDPMIALFGSTDFLPILQVSKHKPKVEEFFFNAFCAIFKDNTSITIEADRETIFSCFHRIRLSDTLQTGGITLFQSLGFMDSSVITNFVQTFLLELMNQVLKEHLLKKMKQTQAFDDSLTDNDQKILFYIAGFIIHALHKRYNKLKVSSLKEEKLLCVQGLQESSDTKTFLSKFKSWTVKKDRGGLKLPTDNFYLLVRHMEIIVRQSVNLDNLSASSLCKDSLKEKIMDAFMVKHYASQLFPASDNTLCLMEDIVNMFLTVRGNAVSKLHRRKLAKSNKQNAKKPSKPSSSLRQVLKTKVTN
ncbi:unnamed protein product [Mytilus coruscus]|uniref:C2H2-type domain-containing protein n=1 Tax=Mytilus coruscus TaxID=42192 RepID=A0A6J8E977_MYTCO|nr:unnamed protein product [Mytilus coruscus]